MGHVRRLRSHLIKSWAGDDPNTGSDRWAVYSHFNRQGRVFDYVLYALRALCDEGFRVVFVTNSRNFDPAQLTSLKPLCAQILKRRNAGYDFGAYKEGILAIDDTLPTQALILTNDSTYGPLFPIRDTLNHISSEGGDLWGLTDSWEHAYHLQSYFYYFNRRLLASPDFLEFWRKIPLVNWKSGVIERLEIELSQFFLARGYRLTAAFPYYLLVDRFMKLLSETERTGAYADKSEQQAMEGLRTHIALGGVVNPTHFFWKVLINEFKYPFIKGELVSRNPVSIYGAYHWYSTISETTSYNVDMISEHLKQFERRRWFDIIPLIRT